MKNTKNKKGIKNDQLNLSEVYRQLRTNIEFSQVDKELKVINIVSTLPDEGKSTVSVNLAKIFADKYRNVLLIDCDLRNPTVHKMLGKSNSVGLTNLLTHFNPGDDLLKEKEFETFSAPGQNEFYFLPAGTKVPNPTEILNSNRFASFIEATKKQFSIIIIDCPPAMMVSDAVPISNIADGTLYVVSAKDTNKNDAKEAIQDLERNGANIIGTVLTKVPGFRDKHYYGYGYGDQNEE